MHLELEEGNSIAALPKPLTEPQELTLMVNGTMLPAGALMMVEAPPEDSLELDFLAVAHHHANRLITPMAEAEEERILSHPDVAAAIETVLPEIEAWERA
jgi:hypothetical protein